MPDIGTEPTLLCRVTGVMGLNSTWTALLFLALLPPQCRCVLVRILTPQPQHVIPTKSLVVKAQFFLMSEEKISRVTWERDAENGAGLVKVKVAEYPGQNTDPRMRLDDRGATLTVNDFRMEDCGVYTITVTNQTNAFVSASCLVREYKAVNHVSVSINVSQNFLHCKEAWGTDPQFSWLHEQWKVTDKVGHQSADGQVLYLTSEPCGRFTCVVSNSIGEMAASYVAGAINQAICLSV